jgi:flagellar biosynthetic protein FliR
MDTSFAQMLGAGLAIAIRLTGIFLFAPMFGSAAIPPRVKGALVFMLTVVLYPSLLASMPRINLNEWPLLVCEELVIGVVIGVCTNLVFDGVQMAGQILSVQLGYSLINILDPQTQVESTVVAVFHQTVTMLVFLRLNIHMMIIRSVARSFMYLPPLSAHFGASFTAGVLHAGASVFAIGVQIAAPVLSATLIADVALGFLGKASAQLPLMLLGPAVKSVLGLLILSASLKYWPSLLDRLFLQSLQISDHLLHLAR